MNLELFLDNLLENHYKQLENKKWAKQIEKHAAQGIVFGVRGGTDASLFPIPSFRAILKSEGASQVLERIIRKDVLPHLKDGKVILNTNLPKGLLEKLKGPPAIQPCRKAKRLGR